jgi:hypothetical protein
MFSAPLAQDGQKANVLTHRIGRIRTGIDGIRLSDGRPRDRDQNAQEQNS